MKKPYKKVAFELKICYNINIGLQIGVLVVFNPKMKSSFSGTKHKCVGVKVFWLLHRFSH